jgi:hypothetical protein
MMPTILFYSRPGCCICEEAFDDLESVQRDIPFELVEIDIDASPELIAEYGVRIPVVKLGDRVLFEHFVNTARLREILSEETK